MTDSYGAGCYPVDHEESGDESIPMGEGVMGASQHSEDEWFDPREDDLHVRRGEVFVTENESFVIDLPWRVTVQDESFDLSLVVATPSPELEGRAVTMFIRGVESEREGDEAWIEFAWPIASVDIEKLETVLNEAEDG